MRKILLAAFAVGVVASSAEAQDQDQVVTLYRNSVIDSTMRVHIATFDAADQPPTYNSVNCQVAAELFQEQPNVAVRYWCEPGHYRRDW